jgi:glycosyltransferase involved in cell wall biosynthesis
MARLLALTEGADFVCYRYRLDAYRASLAERGWELDVLPLARSASGFLAQLSQISAADAVVLQRYLLPWWRIQLIRRAAKVLIFELDDALFLRINTSKKPAYSARRRRRFRWTVRLADACSVGNAFLRQEAAIERGNDSSVHVVPTCVEHANYPVAEHLRTGSHAQMVWVGSGSTMRSLYDAQPGMLNAATRLPGLTLKVICDVFPSLEGVRVLPVRWSSETEAREIAAADIGVAWHPDHPWCLGKCGLKVLQFMAAGLPVVANPIGVHSELIVHGKTGFIASTPDEWGEAISTLAQSPKLRREMGEAARRRLIEHYSVERWGPRFAAMIDDSCRKAA